MAIKRTSINEHKKSFCQYSGLLHFTNNSSTWCLVAYQEASTYHVEQRKLSSSTGLKTGEAETSGK